MFRPINSDDQIRFRPPAEHVKQTDAAYHGQKRDFSYEVEQVKDEHKDHHDRNEEPFGEDTFESTAEQEQDLKDTSEQPVTKNRTPPEIGHVDVQI